MKLGMLILFCVFCLQTISAQNKVVYLTGSDKIPGYKLKTCYYDIGSIKINEQGAAPILQVYVKRKKEFIGGVLENESGKKTDIVDMYLKTKNKYAIFTVVGKDFSRSFTLSTGNILSEEENTTLFYTEKIGIWKITKTKNIMSN